MKGVICLLHLRRFEIRSKSKAINAPAATALTMANPAMGPPPRLVLVTVLAGPEPVDVRDVEVPSVRLGECCESIAGVVTVDSVTVIVLGLWAEAGGVTNTIAPDGKGRVEIVVLGVGPKGSVKYNVALVGRVRVTGVAAGAAEAAGLFISSFAVEYQRANYNCKKKGMQF